MSKTKNRKKIIKLFENSIKEGKPYGNVFSFRDLLNHLKKENQISYQSLSQLLKRLEKEFIIMYLTSKAPRMDTRDILREVYLQKKWPDYCGRIYIYSPMSSKTYKNLMRRYKDKNKNKKLIQEICNFYRQIELASIFQEMYFTKKRFISKRAKLSSKKDVERLYKERGKRIKINFVFYGKYSSLEQKQDYEKKWQKFLKKNIVLNKYMIWISFFQNKKNKYYNFKKTPLNKIINPMYEKLMNLFIKIINNPKLGKNI